MNNIDRAAQLLYNEGCGSGNTAHYIARRRPKEAIGSW